MSEPLSPGKILIDFPALIRRAVRIFIRNFLRDLTPVALFLVAGTVLTTSGFTFGCARGSDVTAPAYLRRPGRFSWRFFRYHGVSLLVQRCHGHRSVPQKSPWGALQTNVPQAHDRSARTGEALGGSRSPLSIAVQRPTLKRRGDDGHNGGSITAMRMSLPLSRQHAGVRRV